MKFRSMKKLIVNLELIMIQYQIHQIVIFHNVCKKDKFDKYDSEIIFINNLSFYRKVSSLTFFYFDSKPRSMPSKYSHFGQRFSCFLNFCYQLTHPD
jgi:hypothetical protein